jgi:hypothetical protein
MMPPSEATRPSSPTDRGRGADVAHRYERSGSTLLVSLEHALYGDFVFTVGLGPIFTSHARWT